MKRLPVTGWRADEWIADLKIHEARELSVSRPELGDPMMAADSGNAGVMDGDTRHFTGDCQFFKFVEITDAFAKETDGGRSHPGADGFAGGLQRGGWLINTRMSHDG